MWCHHPWRVGKFCHPSISTKWKAKLPMGKEEMFLRVPLFLWADPITELYVHQELSPGCTETSKTLQGIKYTWSWKKKTEKRAKKRPLGSNPSGGNRIIQQGPQTAAYIRRVTLLSQVKCRAERYEKDKDREVNLMTKKTQTILWTPSIFDLLGSASAYHMPSSGAFQP